MKGSNPKPVGGRRVARPQKVAVCLQCGDALGGGYPACPTCYDAVERYWVADWQALLDQEGIQVGSNEEKFLARVVLSEPERHAWTVVDMAMSLLQCGECGRELGEGYPECGECGMAFGAAILSEFDATPNEHALHIGRWILRFPHRNSANINTAWRLTMPRLLTGWLPSTRYAQEAMNLIKTGRLDEVKNQIKELDQFINMQASAVENRGVHERTQAQ